MGERVKRMRWLFEALRRLTAPLTSLYRFSKKFLAVIKFFPIAVAFHPK